MANFGDYVYVYWNVGVNGDDGGTISGEEYTIQLAQLIDAGYATLTTRPPWFDNRNTNTIDVNRLLASQIVVSTTEPTVRFGNPPVLWVKQLGNGNIALAVVTGD